MKPVESDAEAHTYIARMSPDCAASCREIYESWRAVGWTPHDALDLTCRILVEAYEKEQHEH